MRCDVVPTSVFCPNIQVFDADFNDIKLKLPSYDSRTPPKAVIFVRIFRLPPGSYVGMCMTGTELNCRALQVM